MLRILRGRLQVRVVVLGLLMRWLGVRIGLLLLRVWTWLLLGVRVRLRLSVGVGLLRVRTLLLVRLCLWAGLLLVRLLIRVGLLRVRALMLGLRVVGARLVLLVGSRLLRGLVVRLLLWGRLLIRVGLLRAGLLGVRGLLLVGLLGVWVRLVLRGLGLLLLVGAGLLLGVRVRLLGLLDLLLGLGLLLLVLWLRLRGLLLWGLGLGCGGVERFAVGVQDEVPDVLGAGVDRLFADLAGLAVDPNDPAVVVDGVEDMGAAAGAVGVLGPRDENGGRRAVAGLTEFVGDALVAVLGVLAGVAEVGAGPVLDVVGAVALTADPVQAAMAVVVVGTGCRDLRVAVPGLHERTGAVGAVVGAAGNGRAAVVLELGPGLEGVRMPLRAAVRVARELVLQRLLVVRER